jgi:excisionase family DNA binding protein
MPTESLELSAPSKAESKLARESSSRLAPYLEKGRREKLTLFLDEEGETSVDIPASLVRFMAYALEQMAKGNAISVSPLHAELTTQEAADLLNVSRPFLVKLLDERKIPHRKVGTHRRVVLEDLLKFKRKTEMARRAALDQLATQGQELDMGY